MYLSDYDSDETILLDESTLASVFAEIPHFFAVISVPDYKYVHLNNHALLALRTYFSFTPEDVLGAEPWAVIPESRGIMLPLLEEVRTTGEKRQFNLESAIPNAMPIAFWEWTLIPHSDPTGEIVRIFAVASDVAEDWAEDDRLDDDSQLVAIFNHARIGIVLVDMNGCFISCNSAFEEFIGTPAEEILGMHVNRVTHPDDIEDSRKLMARIIAGDCDSNRMEKRFVQKDGSVVWGHITISPVEHNGKLEYLIGTVENITSRKKTEEEVLRSEQLLRLAGQAGNVGAFQWDVASGDMWTSPQCRKIFGLTDSTFDGKFDSILPQIHHEDLPNLMLYTEEVFGLGQQHFDITFRMINHSGEVRWIETRGVVEYKDDGSPLKVIGVDVDVTEIKETEEAVKKANERLFDTLNSITDAYMAVDYEGRFLDINRAAEEKIYRHAADDSIGKVFWEEFPALVDTDIHRRFQAMVRERQPMHFEFKSVLAPDWFEAHAYPREDRIELFLRDITKRKNAEELLKDQVYMLQRALLPGDLPDIEGYTLGHVYKPSFAGHEIGGDFYDVFYTGDGKVGILIGDVAGKGIESASLAANARATIRAFAYETSQPGVSLTKANTMLSMQNDDSERFLTAFLAILDPQTGAMSYSSAGHPPAIICRTCGETLRSIGCNPPIAITAIYEFEERTTSIEQGDRLLLYTDGVSEARRDGDLFGDDRICQVMEEYSEHHPNALLDLMLEATLEWAEGQVTDDRAMIMIARTPTPQGKLL